MKAILVIDVGENVDFKKDFSKIRLFTSNGRCINYYNKVKLQPIPNKKHDDENDMEEACYMDGWNACIDEITGETE